LVALGEEFLSRHLRFFRGRKNNKGKKERTTDEVFQQLSTDKTRSKSLRRLAVHHSGGVSEI